MFTVRRCACAALTCDSVCLYSAVWMYMWSVAGLCVCARARSLSTHVYAKARVYESDSVCEPVGSPPVVCSWRYAYGETESSSGAPLPLLWWKAALIEWPGTQPPFLIITAVQSLLITLKVCRAPHSPVMLQAIREREKDPALLTKSTFKKAKKGGKGGRRQSSVAALLVWFLSLSSSWWSRDAVYY